MKNADQDTVKVHYICQTYVEKPSKRGGQPDLKIDKTFTYSTASEAQNRAEREAQHENCAGADAYIITEDLNSGELEPPNFLVRLGNVPEFDDF